MKPTKVLAFVLSTAAFSLALPSFAADVDPQVQKQARKLYDDAKSAMVSGDYERACPRLEAAKALLPEHINTGILLAECYQDSKKLASAAREFKRVKALAETQGRGDKVKDIEQRLTTMAPRIPTLTLVVPADIASLPGLSMKRDLVETPRDTWGKPIPMDPGAFEIRVTALGHPPWQTKGEIKTQGERLEITIDPGWTAPPPQEPETPKPATWPRPLAFTAMGLGVAGLSVGAILGVLALQKNENSKNGLCEADNRCNQTGYDLRKEALSFGTGSTISLIAGGVLVAGGLTLLLVSPRPETKETGQNLSVKIGLGSLGVSGSF